MGAGLIAIAASPRLGGKWQKWLINSGTELAAQSIRALVS